MAVTAVAALGLVCMTLLAAYAVKQQREAEHQRAEAEGLVEFMLTDLRDKLKGVGRLDVLTAVNDRALRYYAGQDIGQLPPQSLERRARLFHAMGEDDETRGNNQSALAEFREAERVTSALLAEAPNDPERVFDEAQSQYWLGYASYDLGNFAAAKPLFESYRRLADQLIRLAPNDARSYRERGYAESNLCSLALKKQPKDVDGALASCKSALVDMNKAASLSRDNALIEIDVASQHAWLADAYRARGDLENARKHRLVQEAILNGLIKHDSRNMHLRKLWVSLQRILAWMDAEAGRRPMAIDRLQRSMAVSDQMIAFDPNNKVWKQQRRDLDKDLAEVKALEPKRNAP
jgi:tetratricopeptide (TPR) repeat protein